MSRFRRLSIMLLIAILTLGPAAGGVLARPAPAPSASVPTGNAALAAGQVQLQAVAGGLSAPLAIANAGDGSGRLFIVQKGGAVRIFANGALQPGVFLDIGGVSDGLSTDGERGLLGVAFHPSFETNRKLFVYYTNSTGDIIIAELTANAGGTSVAASTADQLLHIEHSARSNHNGGHLMFGPNGLLYIFTGDGGGGGDPDENAQNPFSPLGKVLVIAPNLAGGYTVPSGNPYELGGGLPEIWAIGLRNPWKASFDRSTGSLWIADVGQDAWEEVNRNLTNSGGTNYGWDCAEGAHSFEPAGCAGINSPDPVAEYPNGSGPGSDCSVTGGYVYRGAVFPDFVGHYVLGDFCSGRIWTLNASADVPPLAFQGDTSAMISSFGEAENGELYMADYSGGALYRVVAPPFFDVAASQFIDDIMWLVGRGITTGCGGPSFCPTDNVSRQQMASFLVRARSLPPTGTDFFTDDEGSIHEDDINRLAASGIATGCGGGRFCPTSSVSREQMASFLVRALSLAPTGTDFFADDEGSIHEDDINRLAASGITTGCASGSFCPTRAVTREQMAAFLHRAFP